MPFSVNDTFIYWVSAAVILVVVAQSVFFLIKSVQRAKTVGISMSTVRKTILSSTLFTIAPAVSILIGIITLSKFLGLPFPWLRLSILGAVTYELPAATIAANAMGTSVTETITDPKVFATIAWTMTLGIIAGILLVLFGLKKIQKGMNSIGGKDTRWRDIVMDALFLGMISAFVGMLFADIRQGLPGFIPLAVALASALLMAICGILMKKCKMSWLEQYALPISMLGAMALSIPITALMQ
ncbi:MAG: DUF5058 family protein [Clostridia bacterium]|nr:DUF5058 family protein [Clostridia bacterium]MBP3650616.1 DUF5058 family protein [Clostridia bacterium]